MRISLSTDVEDKYFSEIYLSYYSKLVLFAKEYVVSEEEAENIVQDLFLFLWENKEILHAVHTPNAYFLTLTKNRCIDFLRKKLTESGRNDKIQSTFEAEFKLKLHSLDAFDTFGLSDENIETLINDAINSLPEKCREIFLLSKFKGMKYKQISEQLNISVNTVENQMSIALRKLRVKLKHYLPIYIFLII
jgi:RNA polymerase sigma-70 factor (ECF subfamily)